MELVDNFTTTNNIKQLRHIESVRFKLKKLRMYFDKDNLSSPSTVKIMSKNGSEEIISDPTQMVREIIQYNKQHFSQAEVSPPTVEPLKSLFGTGTDAASQKILDGTAILPASSSPILHSYIKKQQVTIHQTHINSQLKKSNNASKNGTNKHICHHQEYI